MDEVGLEQGFEEAARPLSHPETIPVPNHGNPWSLHGLGYPGHTPMYPGFPQITTATHSLGPGGRSVPDCLPRACLLQLACPQEREGQHPRAVSQPETPYMGQSPQRTPSNLSLGGPRGQGSSLGLAGNRWQG